MTSVNKIIKSKFNIYNKNEKIAYKNFPIFKLRAFSPSTFQKYNFPDKLSSDYEIWKYLDSQQEFRIVEYFNDHLKYLTDDEMKAIESVAKKYSEYSKFFNRGTIPIGINQMISSISTIRSLLSYQKSKSLNILEIGPGSGMLGLLANYFKINYSAFDITNAFSIHIMSLYSFLFKKNFKDFGLIPFSNKEIIHKKNTNLSFFPWWHFLNTKFSLPKFDFIIMNACFFEIEEKALHFIFNRLGSHEQRQNVLINDWGSKVFSRFNNEKIIKMESAFNIKKEQIANYDNIHIPETQCLFSYKLLSKPLDFDTAAKNVELRLGYELNIKNKKSITNNTKVNFAFKIIKKIKNIFLGNPEVKEPKVLGTNNIVVNKSNKNHNVKTIDYNQFLLRIKKIEKLNGKPCFTEDELFGYYINSKDHA
jgi:hypothetical protein